MYSLQTSCPLCCTYDNAQHRELATVFMGNSALVTLTHTVPCPARLILLKGH